MYRWRVPALADRPWTPVACGLVLAGINLALNGREYLNYQRGAVRFGAEAGRLARSIFEHGAYADPFSTLLTGPSAHFPPAFPFFYAAVVTLLGTGTTAWLVIKGIAGLALSAQIALLPPVARALGLPLAAGVLGGALMTAASLHQFPDWEVSYAGLCLVILTLLLAPALADPRRASSRVLLIGALWGLAFHLSATLVMAFALWIGWLAWHHRAVLHRPLLGHLLVPLLVITPWTIRNHHEIGGLFFIRDNLGLELAVANNDCASPGLTQNLESGCFAKTHPDLSVAEARRIRELGELAYHEQKEREAVAWIEANPRRFLALTLRRVVLFWFPSNADDHWKDLTASLTRRRYFVIYVATLLSVAGCWELRRSAPGSRVWLGGLLVAYPLIYYVLQYEDRYRQPILWVTFLLAGLAVARRIR